MAIPESGVAWFTYYKLNAGRGHDDSDAFRAVRMKQLLIERLGEPTYAKFDHCEIGVIGSRCCVFVTRENQCTVLYARTRNFPNAKLLASLVLLGS